jgi:hypothetical protein
MGESQETHAAVCQFAQGDHCGLSSARRRVYSCTDSLRVFRHAGSLPLGKLTSLAQDLLACGGAA